MIISPWRVPLTGRPVLPRLYILLRQKNHLVTTSSAKDPAANVVEIAQKQIDTFNLLPRFYPRVGSIRREKRQAGCRCGSDVIGRVCVCVSTHTCRVVVHEQERLLRFMRICCVCVLWSLSAFVNTPVTFRPLPWRQREGARDGGREGGLGDMDSFKRMDGWREGRKEGGCEHRRKQMFGHFLLCDGDEEDEVAKR